MTARTVLPGGGGADLAYAMACSGLDLRCVTACPALDHGCGRWRGSGSDITLKNP